MKTLCTLCAVWLLVFAGPEHVSAAVDFVQITDPHLFSEDKENEKALSDCIEEINTRIQKGARYSFIVLTGDLGIEDLVFDKVQAQERPDLETRIASGATMLADIIAPSKIKLWLVVPGNNDLIEERPESLGHYNKFIAALKQNLQTRNITVIDLVPNPDDEGSGIYTVGKYAFIGFDNASFKANNSETNMKNWESKQLGEISEVEKRLKRGGFEYAYLFYHIPEVDDPYYLSLDSNKSDDKKRLDDWFKNRGMTDDPFRFSGWTVTPKVRAAWNTVVENDQVRGLFAGHLHDWKRETYRGYQWMHTSSYSAASLLKLRICPPIATKRQKDTPGQARGFREVSVADDGKVTSHIIWYNDVAFESDSDAPSRAIFAEQTVTMSIDPATNAASGIIHLANTTREELPISLSAGDFVSSTTAKGLNAKVVFSAPTQSAGQQIYETRIPPASTIALKVDASNLWEAGESEARLFNYATEIGRLKALKYRPAFAVKLVSSTPDKPELEFTKGQERQLTLKNDDPMTYLVDAKLEITGVVVGVSKLTLPPNGNVSFSIAPHDDWFDVAGSFRRQARDGTLMLSFVPSSSIAASGLPVRQIPFKAYLSSTNTAWQTFWSYLFVIGFVTAGGFCSLILSNWVPNQISRADLVEQSDELARRTRDLSTRIDSGLRVLLRVERHRLNQMLYSRWIFSAQLAEVFKVCATKLDVLSKQIDLARQLDRTYMYLEALHGSDAIPTKMDWVQKKLETAADLLHRTEPTPEDLKNATDLISSAAANVGNMGQKDDEFAGLLKGRLEDIDKFLKSFSPSLPPTLMTIKGAVTPDPFLAFNSNLASAEQIAPKQYASVDVNVTHLELIREYVRLFDPTFQKPDLPHLQDFLQHLSSPMARGVREARAFLDQSQEGVFKNDILQTIMATAPTITLEPPDPMENRLIKFSAHFAQPKLNAAAARETVVCRWDFGHLDLKEDGWQAFHYFPRGRNQSYMVQVQFLDDGKPISKGIAPVQSERKITVAKQPGRGFGERNWAEVVRLAISLIVALIGLLAGAQEQLAKLDIVPAAIAVFLLGFGADTIKNLLSPKQQPQK